MERIIKGDELTQSLDIVNDNIARLKELFPEVFTEGKIDFKVLQDILGDEIETEEEYYRFTWAGKAQARREAHKPSTGTLRPCKEESVDWDTTENLYIEGDNLEVLKLLQKSYNNKVKMIYIDPPYNTGKDFVYKDNYKDNLKNYQQITGQIDNEGNKLSTNSDSDGRYHSNWLNMMYPRLKLARNLLKEDGLIFMSIDDNEVDNLRKLGNEIFGEGNFVAEIAWRKTFNQSNIGNIAKVKEYILLYTKNIDNLNLGKMPLSEAALKEYRYEDSKGKFSRTRLMHTTRGRHIYSIETPKGNIVEGTWMVPKEKLLKMIENEEVYWAKDGEGFPNGKVYLDNSLGQISNDFLGKEFGSNQQASLDLEKLMGGRYFDFPKPTTLLKHFIQIANLKTNEIVLDFFSGSGTTAHSFMEHNIEVENKGKFIQIQLPEKIEEKSDTFKAGYKTIADIGKERIRRAGKKIIDEKLTEISKLKGKNSLLQEDQDEINDLQSKINNLDTGFKVFKLDSSNIKGWDGNPDNLEQSLFDSQDNIKTDRTEEDVLFEILLKYGLDLTLPIEEKIIEGKKVFNVGFGALFICLADDITSKVAEGIGAWLDVLKGNIIGHFTDKKVEENLLEQLKKCRVIFKDTGFNDVEKTNAVQTLKRFGIHEIKSI